MSGRRNGPNMFTAIKTTDPKLLSELRKVLVKAIENNYYSKNYIVPLEEAHITITVLGVENENEQFVAGAFRRALEENLSDINSFKKDIQFQGLDCFGDKVLYARPTTGLDFLNKLRQILEKSIVDNPSKIENHCYPTYNPHLTMFHIKYVTNNFTDKLHKYFFRGANHDGVNLYEVAQSFRNTDFGCQSATSIQLCKMGSENRTDDGYWQVIEEVKLE